MKIALNLVYAFCIAYTVLDIIASLVIFKKIRQGKIRVIRN